MKNVVRALTLALTVTGMAATRVPASSAKIITGKVGTVPVPSCGPHDPNACGMGK